MLNSLAQRQQSADGGGGGGGDDHSMTFLDSEVEYQLQRHRKEDSIVTLNVGGTRYEVRERKGRKTSSLENEVHIGCPDSLGGHLYSASQIHWAQGFSPLLSEPKNLGSRKSPNSGKTTDIAGTK